MAHTSSLTVTSRGFESSDVQDVFPIRYGRTLQDLRALRDGCGTVFFVVHAMKCERGRLTIRSPTDFKDIIGNMCALTRGLTAVRIEVSSTREFNLEGVNRVFTPTCWRRMCNRDKCRRHLIFTI